MLDLDWIGHPIDPFPNKHLAYTIRKIEKGHLLRSRKGFS